jgi:hypothetical protein
MDMIMVGETETMDKPLQIIRHEDASAFACRVN